MNCTTLCLILLISAASTLLSDAGGVYTRWGRTDCPSGTEKVYEGQAGGSHFRDVGGGSNHLCLPTVPQWGSYSDAEDPEVGRIYGAEYQINGAPPLFGSNELYQHDVPCVVCRRCDRTSVLMVPARRYCFSGWTYEYRGYLMAQHYNWASTKGRTEFVCVDEHPQDIPGSGANKDGVLFHFVEAICGSLKCPPYVNHRELTCVVCTK